MLPDAKVSALKLESALHELRRRGKSELFLQYGGKSKLFKKVTVLPTEKYKIWTEAFLRK